MKDAMLIELADLWDLQAAAGDGVTVRPHPAARETLRACADTLRMLVCAETAPARGTEARSGETEVLDPEGATARSATPTRPEPVSPAGGPYLRKQAARLLRQLDANRPRRALDLENARRLLEAIAAPSDIEKVIEELIRAAWDWGVSCKIDGVRWGEAGDSQNQMLRDRTANAATRVHAAAIDASIRAGKPQIS